MPTPDVRIRDLRPADWADVERIYRTGIDTGVATFETEVPSWATWNAGHHPAPRLVAERDRHVVGWAALSAISARPVYRGVAEVSIYVAPDARGRRIGRTLLTALITASERAGFWTLQAAIMAANSSSIALHRRCGFREVGIRERLGALHGIWHDVVLLERRSTVTGAGPAVRDLSAAAGSE